MIAQVLLLVPSVNRLYSYKVPKELEKQAVIGSRVRIPMRGTYSEGYILALDSDGSELKLKDIVSVSDIPPLPEQMIAFLKWLSSYYVQPLGLVFKTALPDFVSRGPKRAKYYRFIKLPDVPIRSDKAQRILEYMKENKELPAIILKHIFPSSDSSLRTLLKKGLIQVVYRESAPLDGQTRDDRDKKDFELTREQRVAIDEIGPLVGKGFKPFLLHGVTGSGKTEVYLQLAKQALKKDKSVLILVPEIALTPQVATAFKSRLPARVAVLHSALTGPQRADIWYHTLTGEVKVVLGVRSAVFAPLQNLGLIVVDEEHETTYKQDHGFRYNARDAAVVRAMLAKCPIILGSATPSLESFNNASFGKFTYISLPVRVNQRSLPAVEFVDMRYQGEEAKNSLISPVLEDELLRVTARKEQAILFLNRKGFAPFLLCKDCGHTMECPNCSISMTVHHHPERLICHYCDHTTNLPETCPVCGSRDIEQIGVGLEKVMDELELRFPNLRIARLDAEVASSKKLDRILNRFARKELDVIVGTQILAKGHDFPNVTLVAVLLAELTMGLPDYRAAEKTFGLITQVAGRAGRGEKTGKVLVQTYQPDHYVLRYAATHDYTGFAVQELRLRQQRGYPPFVYMAIVWFIGKVPETTLEQAAAGTSIMKQVNEVSVIGPLRASIFKVRKHYRFQVVLKSSNRTNLNNALWRLYNAMGSGHHGVRIEIDVDPLSLM